MSVAECRWHATLFVVCLSFLCVRGYLQYWIALGSCVCMFLFCSPFAIRYYCCLFSPIFLSITRVYFCHILPQLIFPFDIFFFFFFFFNSCCSLVLLAFHLSDLCIYYSLPFVCAHCYLHIILYGSISIFLLFCFFFSFFHFVFLQALALHIQFIITYRFGFVFCFHQFLCGCCSGSLSNFAKLISRSLSHSVYPLYSLFWFFLFNRIDRGCWFLLLLCTNFHLNHRQLNIFIDRSELRRQQQP